MSSLISAEALSRIAEYFKVLSEVSRLQIVCCLKAGELNVSSIMQATGMGQANVSKHLKLLTQAGIVTRRQEGVSVYYTIANPAIFGLCDIVCDQLLALHEARSQELSQLSVLH